MSAMTSPITRVRPLGFPWPTDDPFLFCVHHDDAYPEGNEALGPKASLAGRNLGQDFVVKDGFRMYHGEIVPGFPQHPHRGFETLTLVRRGLVDHSDSLGATARFGGGDAQWLTAGKGIVHSEMFPLVKADAPNPLELFQIWVNLPKADKFAEPHFSMLWADRIPKVDVRDAEGRVTTVTVVAGAYGEAVPPAPPPRSWASRPGSNVAVWALRLEPGARFELPPSEAGVTRNLYFFRGIQAHRGRPHVRRARRDHGLGGAFFGAARRRRRHRGADAPGAPHRRAGRAVRPVRDEHARGDPAGDGRLPAHAVRGLAVLRRRSHAST